MITIITAANQAENLHIKWDRKMDFVFPIPSPDDFEVIAIESGDFTRCEDDSGYLCDEISLQRWRGYFSAIEAIYQRIDNLSAEHDRESVCELITDISTDDIEEFIDCANNNLDEFEGVE